MSKTGKKYKLPIAAIFLLLYGAAVFQGPLLEGFHRLSHFFQPEHISGHHHFHSHTLPPVSASPEHHHHRMLDAAGKLLSLFADTPLPAEHSKEAPGKKWAAQFGFSPKTLSIQAPFNPKPAGRLFHPEEFCLPTPCPPPRYR
ncbi:MAG: hypothetical protein KDD19_27865 [Phaeodactylibacter sp.]|nr:hypothetical protein [Phaeodactylibacter sp.]MCB9053808.1 hypothetical protein [Lewinellaceae bacterium]